MRHASSMAKLLNLSEGANQKDTNQKGENLRNHMVRHVSSVMV